MPALFLMTPLTLLSLTWLHVVWSFVSGAAFSFAITKRSFCRLPLIASAPFVNAILRGQWSPILVAAMLYPQVSVLLSAKPTIGAALWAGRPTRVAVYSGIALAVLGFAVVPDWPAQWLAGSRTGTYNVLLLAPGGILLLLALARWRLPDARMLAVLAVVPHSTLSYDALYPVTVARTTAQAGTMVLLSWVAFVAPYVFVPHQGYGVWLKGAGAAAVVVIYLPALLLVLRRPNAGPSPHWLEARIASWPLWIRGTPTATQEMD
jgi:hypothetical protein